MNEMIKRRKRLTEPETAFLMRQIVEATKYLHEQLVIHRDLKLEIEKERFFFTNKLARMTLIVIYLG